MAIVLTIAGVNRTSMFQAKSFTYKDELNSRNTCAFDILDPAGTYVPDIGNTISIVDGATTHYAGTITGRRKNKKPGHIAILTRVRSSDYNQYADRHRVAAVFDNAKLGDIVDTIITDYLAADGVTIAAGLAGTGPIIMRISFNRVKVSDAFNELATISGWSWNIGYDKVLTFAPRASIGAPVGVTDTNGVALETDPLTVEENTGQYRNSQTINAGTDLTASRTDDFVGDGTRQTFTLPFPVGEAPTSITVDAVAETIGIRSVDTGKDWYWSKGDPNITQDAGGTPLTSSNTLAVTYKGLFPIVEQAQDDAEITARKAIEGGSGIWESVESQPQIDNVDLAHDLAAGLLRRFPIPEIVQYKTDQAGLAAGQLQLINIPALGLNTQYLIERVEARDMDGQFLRYSITAVSGEALGGWKQFFNKIINAGKTFVIRDNEVVVLLRAYCEQVTVLDNLSAVDAVPENRVDHAKVDYSEVG